MWVTVSRLPHQKGEVEFADKTIKCISKHKHIKATEKNNLLEDNSDKQLKTTVPHCQLLNSAILHQKQGLLRIHHTVLLALSQKQ